MKTFKSVEEWLKSSPKKDEATSVLAFINKKALSQARVELYQVERAIRWYDKVKKDFQKHGIKTLSPEIEEAYKRHTKERADLLNILPPPRQMKKQEKKAARNQSEGQDVAEK